MYLFFRLVVLFGTNRAYQKGPYLIKVVQSIPHENYVKGDVEKSGLKNDIGLMELSHEANLEGEMTTPVLSGFN